MKIPNCHNAEVPESKILDYLLDLEHPEGEPKARFFYRLIMEEYNLEQKDLPELGSEGVVSEILSGKRELNVRQVKALSERFRVPSSVFG